MYKVLREILRLTQNVRKIHESLIFREEITYHAGS